MTQPPMTESEAEARLTQNNRDVDALVAKGDHRLADSDRRAAMAFYDAAVAAGGSAAVTAGQRELIDHARRRAAEIQAGIPDHIVDSLTKAGFAPGDWHPRFRNSIDIMLGRKQRVASQSYPQLPNSFYYDGLPYHQFADPSGYDWREAVEAATDAIREEAAQLSEEADLGAYVRKRADRPQGDVHGMLEDTRWSTFDLTDKGVPVADRIARYPTTHEAIAGNAPLCDIPNRAPSIMFSRLAAKAHIPPHTGMVNTRLICHLPLVVPGEGYLRVGNESRTWKEGELLVFDDTVEHEARNQSTADRLVLIFDIWRPELSADERAQVRALFGAVDSY